MIVVVQTRGLESFSLWREVNIPKRCTGLESQLLDAGDELGDLRSTSGPCRAPRCSHVKRVALADRAF